MKKPLRIALYSLAAIAFIAFVVVINNWGFWEPKKDAQIIETNTGLTGGVAATVNGVEIEEDKITRAINNIRLNGNYTDEDKWKEYLKGQKATPESTRYDTLSSFVEQQLILQFAEKQGVTTTDEEIQSYVDKMAANYSSQEKWEEACKGGGFETVDDYKAALRYSILNKKLEEGFEEAVKLDDDALLAKVKDSASSYSGAKKSSHILFKEEDQETANNVLQRILNGELSFEDAVQEYSTDTASKEDGGNVGWDRLTSFVTEYTDALANLNKGDVTKELVKSKFGYHIIMVTDVFTAPETVTSLDQVPDEFVEEIRTNAASSDSSTAKDDWIKEMKLASDVVINPMPENVPYNVDMLGDLTADEIKEADKKALEKLTAKVEEEEQQDAIEGGAIDQADANGEGSEVAAAETAPAPETTEVAPEAS